MVQFLKPIKVDFTPRLKMKGKSKTGRKEARKKAVKVAHLKVSRAQSEQSVDSITFFAITKIDSIFFFSIQITIELCQRSARIRTS